MVDLVEEARGAGDARAAGDRRARPVHPAELLDALTDHTRAGQARRRDAWPSGRRADLVAVRLDSVRTAGTDPAQILFAATAADVDTV